MARTGSSRPQLLPSMISPPQSDHRKRKRRRRWAWQLRRWLWLVIAAYLLVRAVYFVADKFMRWVRLPRYSSVAERRFRANRFPTVDQRIRLYMAHWYLPPCEGTQKITATTVVVHRIKNSTGFWSTAVEKSVNDFDYQFTEPGTNRNLTVSSIARSDQVFYFSDDDLYYCYKQKNWSIRFYCQDARISMREPAMDNVPILLEFTDHTKTALVSTVGASRLVVVENPNIPVIKKIRKVLPKDEIDDIINDTLNDSSPCQDLAKTPIHQNYREAIVWLLNTNRHFKHSLDIPRYDISWTRKKDSAIFRGELTGLQYDPTLSDFENCERLPRCRLVYRHAHSTLVDARLINTFQKVPSVFSGVNMTGPELRRSDMLQHKGLIILEGNDVASGLKWSMVSNSVVLMPPPTVTSWAMEELLEPWYHFIPLLPDLSDVEKKVQWMLDNQEESKRIAHRAKLWVLDLYFHPDAMKDAKRINEEILRRYRLLFEEQTVL